uniref:Uncharacterized protein n=1 Tax=Falco tinnunculus TaxID=100819 RepID=A0A8C4V057_FALTI
LLKAKSRLSWTSDNGIDYLYAQKFGKQDYGVHAICPKSFLRLPVIQKHVSRVCSWSKSEKSLHEFFLLRRQDHCERVEAIGREPELECSAP